MSEAVLNCKRGLGRVSRAVSGPLDWTAAAKTLIANSLGLLDWTAAAAKTLIANLLLHQTEVVIAKVLLPGLGGGNWTLHRAAVALSEFPLGPGVGT